MSQPDISSNSIASGQSQFRSKEMMYIPKNKHTGLESLLFGNAVVATSLGIYTYISEPHVPKEILNTKLGKLSSLLSIVGLGLGARGLYYVMKKPGV